MMKINLLIIGLVACVIVMFIDNFSIGKKTTKNDWPTSTETQYTSHKKVCLDGVFYWKNGHGLSAAFNQDSTVQICKD